MDDAQRAIIRIRVDKCREDLATAQVDMQHGYYRAAVTRAYYAIFHIASAALLTIGIVRSKHSGVEAAFSEFFIKPRRIEPEYNIIYRRSRRFREDQEYSDDFEHLDAAHTQEIIADAERFVARVERYLRETGAIN